MPGGFLDVAGDGGRKADLDVDVAVAVEDAERLGQVLLEVEVRRAAGTGTCVTSASSIRSTFQWRISLSLFDQPTRYSEPRW